MCSAPTKKKEWGEKNLQGVIFKIMTAINKVLPERLCNFLVLLLHLPPVCLKPFTCHCHSSSIQTCQRCSHSHIASTACFSGTHGPVMIFVGGGGQKHDDKKFLNETSKRQTSNIQNLLHPHKVAEGAWICEKEHLKCLSSSVNPIFQGWVPPSGHYITLPGMTGQKKRKKNGHCPTVTWITTAYNKIKTKSTLKSNE